VPSDESQQLAAARRETSELRQTFTERQEHLSSQATALLKGNETLQKRLDPFEKIANRLFPQLDTQAALARLAADVDQQRKELNTIRRYTGVSKLNVIGTTGTVQAPLREETGISRILEGAFTITNDRASYSCDASAIEKFREVIAKFPDFPFSYSGLASCLRLRGDSAWKGYATQAIEILKNTTTIEGHHRSHDHVLRELEQALGS
jgi:hypothetical protein